MSAPGGVSAPRGGLLPGVPGPGGFVSEHALRQTTPRERRLLLRTVRILLECILVMSIETDCLTGRIGSVPILLVKWSVTIHTM